MWPFSIIDRGDLWLIPGVWMVFWREWIYTKKTRQIIYKNAFYKNPWSWPIKTHKKKQFVDDPTSFVGETPSWLLGEVFWGPQFDDFKSFVVAVFGFSGRNGTADLPWLGWSWRSVGWTSRLEAAGSSDWLLGGECAGWRSCWRSSRGRRFSIHRECPLQHASFDASVQAHVGAPCEDTWHLLLARASGQDVFSTRQEAQGSQVPSMVHQIPFRYREAPSVQTATTEGPLFELKRKKSNKLKKTMIKILVFFNLLDFFPLGMFWMF